MPQNILIEFNADASGLAPGVEGISQLLNLDKNVSTSFAKTNDTLKQRQQLIEGNTSALQKFVQGLVNSQKAAIGDTYNKTLTEIRKQFQLTDAEAQKFYQNLIENSNQAIVSSTDQEEVETLTKLIDAATIALNQFEQKKKEVAATDIVSGQASSVAPAAAASTAVPAIEVPVKVDEASLQNIPLEIKQGTEDVAITPKITFTDAQIQQAVTNLQAQLSAKDFNFDLLSAARAQAEEILPTLSQDSEAYKQLSADILAANTQLDKFIQTETSVNRITQQLQAALSSGLGKVDFSEIDLTKIDQARVVIEALSGDALKMEALLKEAAVALKGMDPSSTHFGELVHLVDAGTIALNQFKEAQDKVGISEDSAGAKTMKATTLLRNMRQELLVMEETGQTFSKTFGLSFDQLSIKAAKLQDGINDTSARIQQMASDSFAIDALVGALTGIAAGFNAASGAAILFGGDQQNVQEAILKTQAAMQLLNGLQTIYNLLIDQSVVKTGAQVLIQKVLGTQTKANAATLAVQTASQKGLNAAELTGVETTEALNAAMETNPIGLILAGVALLVTAFATYELTIGKVTDEEIRRKAALESMAEAETKAADSIAKEEANLNVLLATAQDETLSLQERQRAIENINKQYPEYLSSLSLANIATKESADLIQQEIDLLQKRALVQAAQDVYTEKLKKVAEAQAEVNKINREGVGFWRSLFSTIPPIGEAEIELKKATDEANGALDTVKNTIEGVSKQMQNATSAFQGYIYQFGSLKASVQDLKFPLIPQIKPFDAAAFDDEKKKALEAAQYRIDVAKKGSAEELAARRAYIQLAHNYDENDARLLKDEKLALYGKYIDQIQQLDAEERERYFKDTIANAEAVVLQLQRAGKDSSQAFFDAQRDVLKKTAAEQIAQEGITAGQIKKIRAQLAIDLQNIDIAQKNKALENQKTLTQDRLDLAEKGSQEELKAEIAILEIEKQIQINNAKDNAAKIQEINDNFRKQELEKIIAFNQKVAQESDQSAIASTQHQINELSLQGFSETSEAIIELKKKLIEQQAQLEIDSIPTSGITEKKRRQLIQAIYDKELLDKKALEDAKAQAEINDSLLTQQGILNIQKEGLNNLSSVISAFGPARKQLDDQLLQNELANIQASKDALTKKFADGLISFTDFYNQIKELDDQSTEAQIANAERVAQRRIAAFNFFADKFQQSIDGAFDSEKRRLEDSAQANQDLVDKKLITQDAYNRRQEQLKKGEAAIDKQKAIFDIIIDFAKQLFAIKAQTAVLLSNPVTAPFAAIAAAQIPVLIAQEAISLALVATQKFKTGKIRIEGPGTETSDSIPARISKNESVINAAATTGKSTITVGDKSVTIIHEELLRAINEFRLHEYMQNLFDHFDNLYEGWKYFTGNSSKEMPLEQYLVKMIPHFDAPVFQMMQTTHAFSHLPVMKDMPQWVDRFIAKEFHAMRSTMTDIDYDKIGKSVAEHVGRIEDLPSYEWNIDNDGIAQAMITKETRTEFLNKKFSSKK